MRVPRLLGWVFQGADDLHRASDLLRDRPRRRGRAVEFLPLLTCRRHELFILADEPIGPPSSVIRTFETADAALRLFEITAGVLSDVTGEAAVAAQVRAAIRGALRQGLAKSTMAKLVRRAMRAGEALRERVRETTPIIELPELVADLVQGRTVLLGAGALGRSIHQVFSARGAAPAVWATRSPRSHAHATIPAALRSLRAGDTLISAIATSNRFIDVDSEHVNIIDLGERPCVQHASGVRERGAAWNLSDVVARSRERLAPQSEAVARAAHRLPALAEAALAECICPSIKSLNRAIGAFRTSIIEAEMKRLAPVLAAMDEAQANVVRRSISHAAARTAHPLHEYVNALGRQGRVDDARLFVDHILGSRIGIQSGAGVPRGRTREEKS